MINIRLNCLANVLNNKNIRATDELAECIKANALKAWQNRQESETNVRFIHKMSDGFYRFLNIKQQNGSLLVYI